MSEPTTPPRNSHSLSRLEYKCKQALGRHGRSPFFLTLPNLLDGPIPADYPVVNRCWFVNGSTRILKHHVVVPIFLYHAQVRTIMKVINLGIFGIGIAIFQFSAARGGDCSAPYSNGQTAYSYGAAQPTVYYNYAAAAPMTYNYAAAAPTTYSYTTTHPMVYSPNYQMATIPVQTMVSQPTTASPFGAQASTCSGSAANSSAFSSQSFSKKLEDAILSHLAGRLFGSGSSSTGGASTQSILEENNAPKDDVSTSPGVDINHKLDEIDQRLKVVEARILSSNWNSNPPLNGGDSATDKKLRQIKKQMKRLEKKLESVDDRTSEIYDLLKKDSTSEETPKPATPGS